MSLDSRCWVSVSTITFPPRRLGRQVILVAVG
jgi:hypothetical protein